MFTISNFKSLSAPLYNNLREIQSVLNIYKCQLRCSSQAAICHKINENLKIEEVKDQKLKKGEIRIKTLFCGLNPRDLTLLQGTSEAKLPFTPGFEVTGEVIEKAEDKDETENPIEVGDKVVALTKSSLGGLSTHCVALQENVWKYNSLEPNVAAGLVVNYGHALLSLFRRAKIKKGTTVLVTVESGGLGLAALDIAANVYKAKVVGVCGSEEKADLLREKGAWSALKMKLSNLRASVEDVTDKKGVDVAYETVGGDFLIGAMQCVKHEGLLVLADIPPAEDTLKPAELFNLNTFNFSAVSLDHYRLHDFLVYRQAVSDVIELCEQNLISPHVAKTFKLEEVNDAVKMLKENQVIGKILIKMPHK